MYVIRSISTAITLSDRLFGLLRFRFVRFSNAVRIIRVVRFPKVHKVILQLSSLYIKILT